MISSLWLVPYSSCTYSWVLVSLPYHWESLWLVLCKSLALSYVLHYPYHIWADDFIFVTRTIFKLHIFWVLAFSTHIEKCYVNPPYVTSLPIPYLGWWFHLCDSYHIRVTHILGLSLLYPYWEHYVNPYRVISLPIPYLGNDFIFVTRTIFELHIFLVLAFSTYIENAM